MGGVVDEVLALGERATHTCLDWLSLRNKHLATIDCDGRVLLAALRNDRTTASDPKFTTKQRPANDVLEMKREAESEVSVLTDQVPSCPWPARCRSPVRIVRMVKRSKMSPWSDTDNIFSFGFDEQPALVISLGVSTRLRGSAKR